MSTDTIRYFAETVANLRRAHPQLVGLAHVADPVVEARDMMANILSNRVFRPAGVPYQMFDDCNAACEWLNHMLAQGG